MKTLTNLLIILLFSLTFSPISLRAQTSSTINPFEFAGKVISSLDCKYNNPRSWLVTVDESQKEGGEYMYIPKGTASVSTTLKVGSIPPTAENGIIGRTVLGTYTPAGLYCKESQNQDVSTQKSSLGIMTALSVQQVTTPTSESGAGRYPNTTTSETLNSMATDVTADGVAPTDVTVGTPDDYNSTEAFLAQKSNAENPEIGRPSYLLDINLSEREVLKAGSDPRKVLALQNFLVEEGYMTNEQVNTGAGIYGPRTRAAVTAYQAANPLTWQSAGASGPTGNWGSYSQAYALGNLGQNNSLSLKESVLTLPSLGGDYKVALVPLGDTYNSTVASEANKLGTNWNPKEAQYSLKLYDQDSPYITKGTEFAAAPAAQFGGLNDPYVSSTETGAINGKPLATREFHNGLYLAGTFDYTKVPRETIKNAVFEAVNPARPDLKPIQVRAADWANAGQKEGWEFSPAAALGLGFDPNKQNITGSIIYVRYVGQAQ